MEQKCTTENIGNKIWISLRFWNTHCSIVLFSEVNLTPGRFSLHIWREKHPGYKFHTKETVNVLHKITFNTRSTHQNIPEIYIC